MGKHTKGPWSAIKPHGNNVGMRIFSEDLYLGFVGNSDRDQEWAEANARLIAAAPDMYEALQLALPLLVRCNEITLGRTRDNGAISYAMQRVGEALKKAEGGAE